MSAAGAVEARFYISGYERNAYNKDATTVKLQAVSRGEHNKTWAAATPNGQISMTIMNESAAQWFVNKLGEEVAVTFVPAPSNDLPWRRSARSAARRTSGPGVTAPSTAARSAGSSRRAVRERRSREHASWTACSHPRQGRDSRAQGSDCRYCGR